MSPFQQTRFDLTGRAALVTGAGGGIGQASAIALAQAGAIVGIHYRSNKDGAIGTLAEIQPASGRRSLLPGDLRLEGDVNRMVDDFVSQAGRLDAPPRRWPTIAVKLRSEETPHQKKSLRPFSFSPPILQAS